MPRSSNSRLLSPSEVAKRLAAEREKVSKAPEILARISDLVVGLEKQRGDIKDLPFDLVIQSLEELKSELAPVDYRDSLETLANGTAEILERMEEQKRTVVGALDSIVDILLNLPKPEKQEIPDMKPDFAEISRKLDKMPTVAPADEPQPDIFPSFRFSNITRDENGDISTATVDPVTKH